MFNPHTLPFSLLCKFIVAAEIIFANWLCWLALAITEKSCCCCFIDCSFRWRREREKQTICPLPVDHELCISRCHVIVSLTVCVINCFTKALITSAVIISVQSFPICQTLWWNSVMFDYSLLHPRLHQLKMN